MQVAVSLSSYAVSPHHPGRRSPSLCAATFSSVANASTERVNAAPDFCLVALREVLSCELRDLRMSGCILAMQEHLVHDRA